MSLFASGPSVLLLLAVMGSKSSGNDKAPFLVLAVITLLAIVFTGASLAAVTGRNESPQIRSLALGALWPLLYAGAVITLSRMGVVDSLVWLGFR